MRYLFDNYVASRFLGVRVNDPMIEKFMKSVKGILNELVSHFLVDYSVLKDIDYKDAFEAYKQFYRIYRGDYVQSEIIKEAPEKVEVYQILLDTFFYAEMDKRINEYYGKLYDRYVPALSEKNRADLEVYIEEKNNEKNKREKEMIERLDKGIAELELLRKDYDEKMDKMIDGESNMPSYAEFIEMEKKEGKKSFSEIIRDKFPKIFNKDKDKDKAEEKVIVNNHVAEEEVKKQEVMLEEPILGISI